MLPLLSPIYLRHSLAHPSCVNKAMADDGEGEIGNVSGVVSPEGQKEGNERNGKLSFGDERKRKGKSQGPSDQIGRNNLLHGNWEGI